MPITFRKHEVIYNVGDERRVFFFLTSGFVKVGTITANGREVIYDIRRGGDVVGELCVSERSASGPSGGVRTNKRHRRAV